MDSEKQYAYTLLNNAYYGTGLFSVGRGLIRHPRESLPNYNFRKKLAYYLNYTGPIVNASVDPIFRDEIRREYNNTEKFRVFLEDVDRKGTNLQEYIRQQATLAKLYGVVYILVNNAEQFGETVADNIKNRALPYLVSVEPRMVTDWQFDDKGVLVKFAYKNVIYNADNVAKTRYYIWTPADWQIFDESKQTISSGTHNLGHIPVVQWFGRSAKKTDMLPPPEFLSIAQTNYHIYHLCSLLTQILNNQTFSVLTMPSDSNDMDITLGTNNMLLYPQDSSHAPSFIAPDKGPAEVLMSQIDRLIKEMYRMSGINSLVGVESTKSGVAKQWDFERTNQRLADFSVQCEEAETDIIELYEQWANERIGYKCEYPRDFKINDIADSLSQAQQALDLGFNSDTFKGEVGKKVLEAYMPNLESDTYEAIVDEIEESLNDAAEGAAFGRGGVGDGFNKDGQSNSGLRGAGKGASGEGHDPAAGSSGSV